MTDLKNNFRTLASDYHRQFAIGDEAGKIQLIDWTTQDVTPVLDNSDPIVAMAFTSDGSTLAVIGNRSLHMWDMHTSTLINQLDFNDYETYRVPYRLNFSPDGRWLVYKDFVWQIEQSGQLVAVSNVEAIAAEYPVFAARPSYYQMSSYDFQHDLYSIGSIGANAAPVRVARISDQEILWSAPYRTRLFSYWQITTSSEHWLAVADSAGSIEIYAVPQDT